MALIFASKPFARFRRLHLQRVVHPVEVIEQPRHCGDLDDLSFVVMLAQPGEQRVIDSMRVDRELLRVRERRLFFVVEWPALEVEDLLELRVRRSMPRSLRGVRRVSIVAAVQPRHERRDELLRPHRHRPRVRDRIHVRDHRFQDLGPMRVDAEHVRHVAARLADVRIQLANVLGHLRFVESCDSHKRKRPA